MDSSLGLARTSARLKKEEIVKKLIAAAGLMLVMAIPATYAADDGMTIIQDFGTKWQDGWNSGDPTKVSDLYATDAALSSGVLGTVKGKSEIEKALAAQMKKMPKLSITPVEGHQIGNVAWGNGDFAFPNGPSGHYGLTLVSDAGTWHIVMHVSNVTPKQQQ
jgi:hypothetical protein